MLCEGAKICPLEPAASYEWALGNILIGAVQAR